MRKLLGWLSTALLVGLTVSALSLAEEKDSARRSTRIVLLGDSTMCEYPQRHGARGWGQYLQERRPESIEVFNLARSGRSTKTCIAEGLWEKALKLKPDYVLIQFGHNDSHSPPASEHTDPATDFKDNLKKFIAEARAVNAVPILITPMHRRKFTAEGKLDDNLRPYADAMQEVATELETPLIDLHALSGALYSQLGPQNAPDHASSPQDHTHFNEKGARAMCDIVCDAMPQAVPALGALLAPCK